MVQETQRISHGAIRRFRNVTDRPFLRFHLLFLHQFLHPACDGLDGDPPEIIPLTSGQNRHRNLVYLRRRQNKNHILRRFFQGFQKRIKSSYGKHMHLIDDIHFISPFCRTVSHLFPDLTNVVHAVIRCRIDLDDVHRSACRNGFAHFTFPTGTSAHRVLTVYRFSKYFCRRGLSRPPGPAKQVCMADPVCPDLVF